MRLVVLNKYYMLLLMIGYRTDIYIIRSLGARQTNTMLFAVQAISLSQSCPHSIDGGSVMHGLDKITDNYATGRAPINS